jgi:hypothetical protein
MEVWSPPQSADVTPSGGGCAVVRSQWWNQPYDELESKVIATLARRFSSVCATQSLHCPEKIFKIMLDNNLGAKGCQFQIVTISYQNTHPGIFSSKFIEKVQKARNEI